MKNRYNNVKLIFKREKEDKKVESIINLMCYFMNQPNGNS